METSFVWPAIHRSAEAQALNAMASGPSKKARSGKPAPIFESERVLRTLFASVADRPGHDAVITMAADFLRGFVLSSVLRKNPARLLQMISNWVRATQILFDHWKWN